MRLLLAAAAGALVLAGVASAGVAKKPVLLLSDTTISGTQFAPNAKVTIIATGAKTLKRVVTTSARGTFTLELPFAFRFARCGGVTVSALGPTGQRAFTGIGTTMCMHQLPGRTTPGIAIPGTSS
jgi:hypothetical protein